jgi:HlyD family secretion protein
VDTAAAQTSEAQARRTMAQTSAERYRELARVGFVSKEALDAKVTEAEATRAGLEAADAAQAAAKQDINRAQAEIAALDKQRLNLRLVSPVDGIITAREAEPGNTVVAGQAVVRVIDPTSVWVKVRIDQARAGAIAAGQAARIVLRSRRSETLPGKVVRMELQSDAVTEERLVDVAFEQPPEGWSIGELAEVMIDLPKIAAGLFVPSPALQRVKQQSGVWRIEAGRARFAPVTAGVSTLDGRTQVLDGLRDGDWVITHSEQALAPDMRVRAVAPPTSAP